MDWDLKKAAQDNPELAASAADRAEIELEEMRRAKVISDIEEFLNKYAILPPAASLPMALWAVGTFYSSVFDAYAYLLLSSPMPGCGKSQVEEMLEILSWNAWHGSQPSESAVFRMITGTPPPTLLFDETEFLNKTNKSEKAEAIAALINSGYRKGQTVPRAVAAGKDFKIQFFSTYCPKALAAIGRLPDAVMDRCLVITMQRKKADEKIARFRFKRAKDEMAQVREAMRQDMNGLQGEVAQVYDAMPDHTKFSDRNEEILRPLLALCQVYCPGRAAELEFKLMALCSDKTESAGEDNFKAKLLGDLRRVWPGNDERVSSKELIARMVALEDSPWSGDHELNPRKMARMLAGFGVRPSPMRIGGELHRGYLKPQMDNAWARYLPAWTEDVSEEVADQNVTSLPFDAPNTTI